MKSRKWLEEEEDPTGPRQEVGVATDEVRRRHPTTPVVLYARGDVGGARMAASGAQVLAVDHTVDRAGARIGPASAAVGLPSAGGLWRLGVARRGVAACHAEVARRRAGRHRGIIVRHTMHFLERHELGIGTSLDEQANNGFGL